MKPQKKHTEKNVAKGDRLNWVPLQDLKPVVLNDNLIRGTRMTPSAGSNNKSNFNLFVP